MDTKNLKKEGEYNPFDLSSPMPTGYEVINANTSSFKLNPKALVVFQEWIAANYIEGELIEWYETESEIRFVRPMKLSTPPQVDSGTS